MDIERIQKEIFKCSQSSSDKKIIIEYELEQKNKGWLIKKITWDVQVVSPSIIDFFIPNDIIEQILIPETAKNKLND